MGRPKRKDRFEKIQLECIVCHKTFERVKWIEESRIQQNKMGPTCSTKCSGKLGWKSKKSLKRESNLTERE